MRSALVASLLLLASLPAFGREASSPMRPRPPYTEIKSHLATAWDLAESPAEKRRLLWRTAATEYRSSARRVLGPLDRLDPELPGLRKAVLLTASDNKAVRQGAVRAVRVAGTLAGDGRFDIERLDERVVGPDGKMRTDRDIVYRHRRTGQTGRFEVKDVSPETQAKNLAKYCRQIDQMAEELRQTGQPQVWVNRRPVHPAIRAYAETRGILVYGDVTTSPQPAAGSTPFAQVADSLDQEHRRLVRAARGPAVAGASARGTRAWLAASEGTAAADEWGRVAEGRGSWRKAARHTAGMLSGTATIASRAETAGRLASMSRFGGPAAVLLLVAAEGFAVAEWQAGEINTRQFVEGQAGLAGGLAGGGGGAWVGAKVGALAGLPFGPKGVAVGAVVGAVAGGLAGGYAGSTAAIYGAARYYGSLDAAEQAELFRRLQAHYAAME